MILKQTILQFSITVPAWSKVCNFFDTRTERLCFQILFYVQICPTSAVLLSVLCFHTQALRQADPSFKRSYQMSTNKIQTRKRRHPLPHRPKQSHRNRHASINVWTTGCVYNVFYVFSFDARGQYSLSLLLKGQEFSAGVHKVPINFDELKAV